jgi:hypothetical protein
VSGAAIPSGPAVVGLTASRPDAGRSRLDLAPPQRQPQVPTLIEPGRWPPASFPDLAALAERLAVIAEGRTLSFQPAKATLPDFDTFPALNAYAEGRWIACLAIQDRACADVEAALAVAAARRGAAA